MMTLKKATVQDEINRYLSKLERNLKQLPEDEQKDIIMEIKSLIYDSLSGADNEQEKLNEVLTRLGDPRIYAKELISQHIGNLVQKGGFRDNFKLFIKQMITPFLFVSAVMTFLMESNTLFLYYEMMEKGQAAFLEFALLIIYNLPAIFVVIIPVAVLYAVPVAFYTMVKSSEQSLSVKSSKVWSMVILSGIISTILSFAINELIVPVTNHKTVEMSKSIILRSSEEPLIFSEQKSIQEMSFVEAKKYIDNSTAPKQEKNKMSFYLYTKLTMPLACLACAIFASFIGCLMLSEMFNNNYLLIVIGLIIPTFIWYSSYSVINNISQDSSPLLSLVPDLIIGLFGLLMVFGVFLKKENEIKL